MQVANALNNTIRILFNPKVEKFRLFDFLVVKSIDDRYLAQVIEIYEDKFDSSQNVAKIKLFYKIAKNNEVMPYDNFTPSKECEISKVRSEEVENFINNDKETFVFATDAKNSMGLNIQYDFFNNNAIVLADKIENANALSLNIAKKLSVKKNVVILDFTGVIEFEDAKKIKACKNFKMPLNYSTMDYVFDRCLEDASLEFQAIGMEILNAIKQFAKKQESAFIPFNAFANVIIEQYKVTPYSELKLLLARMKKNQMNEIFAKNKKDYQAFSKTIQKNPITIVDLSGLDSTWQKGYVDYIVSELQEEVYLITRINDESFGQEAINTIYNKKPNIKFIPNVSYNYFKLPSIIQYCKNYILMPSLNQRNDFLDANFALANIISDGCIVFGENTDNFLYLARDYELDLQEKRKNYRKIALNLVNNDEEEPVEIEEDKVSDSQKLMQELSSFEERSIREHEEQAQEEVSHDEFQEIVQQPQTEEIPKEVETIRNIQEIKLSNEPMEPEAVEEVSDENSLVFENNEEETPQEKTFTDNEIIQNIFDNDEAETQETEAEQPAETKEDEPEIAEAEAPQQEDKKEDTKKDDSEIGITDEELDFFELAESSAELEKEENVVIDDVEYKVKSDNYENDIKEEKEEEKKDNELDLSEVASDTVENNFEEIINSKADVNKPTFEIDENTTIQVDLDAEKENLPIFKEEENQGTQQQYEAGNTVFHKKYGKGTIVKTIQYDQRQLLQIDFVDSGKKLLDPKIADIQLEQ